MVLREEGHHPVTAPDGAAALELLAHEAFQPDLILADYNLPNGMNGLLAATKVRESLHCQIPVVILTGDISTDTLRHIAARIVFTSTSRSKPRMSCRRYSVCCLSPDLTHMCGCRDQLQWSGPSRTGNFRR